MSVTLNGTSGLVFSDGTIQGTAGAMAFRNRIINGDMRIDQRNNGAALNVSTATGNQLTLDRWAVFIGNSTAVATVQQDSLAPPGFSNSLKITVNTADTSVGTDDRAELRQRIEGNNTYDLAWGTSDAKAITISFWVRSNNLGTYSVTVYPSNALTHYVSTYQITSANTWELKTITVPGATTGTWLTDNGIGVNVRFGLMAGSNVTGPDGSWQSSAAKFGATTQTNFFSSTSNNFYITGVQLEKAAAATSFEHRPIGTELAMCERYYQIGTTYFNGQVTSGSVYYTLVNLRTYMRAAPTVSYTNIGNAAFPSSGNSYLLEPTRVGESRTGSTNSSSGIFTSNFAASSEL